MAAIAHGWKPSDPKLRRIPKKVAKDFNKADTGTAIRRRDKRRSRPAV